jgi:hypothetical protein
MQLFIEISIYMENSLRLSQLALVVDLKTGGIAIKTEGYTSIDDYDFINIVVANEVPESNYAVFARSRGTIAKPKSIQKNDELFSFFYAGYDTEDQPGWAAELTVGSEGEIKAGIVPGYFAFKTMGPDGVAKIAFSIHSDMTVRFNRSATLTHEQVQPEIAKYLKVQVGNEYYAMPLHLIK